MRYEIHEIHGCNSINPIMLGVRSLLELPPNWVSRYRAGFGFRDIEIDGHRG